MKIFTLCKPYLLAHKYMLGAYVLLAFTAVVITILSPYILGDFIDDLIQGAGVGRIVRFCVIFGGLSLLKLVKGYFSSFLYVKMQTQMGYDFVRQVLRHVQNVSLSYSHAQDIAYLNNRVVTDVNGLIGFCIGVLQGFVVNLMVMAVPFFILFSLNPFIASLMLAFLLLYMLLYFACRRQLYEVGLALREWQARFSAGLLEQLRHIKLIKTRGWQAEMNRRADGHFAGYNHVVVRNWRVNYLYSGMDGFISTIAQIVLFVVGGLQILSGYFTIGMFTIFTAYFNLMLGAVRYFYGLGAAYQNAKASFDRLKEIFAQKPETYGHVVLNGIESIRFRDVSFSYQNAQVPVVSHVNMALTRGKIYAFTGGNGAGKSSRISLLLGLYVHEISGAVEYNGVDIRRVDMLQARRQLIGYAPQEPMLVNDSILYNLTFDGDAIDPARLARCAQVLGMEDFLAAYGLGYEINEANSNVSGGEKQKIAILSVLCKNPQVMIFDEPTSALDAQTTGRFIAYLQAVKGDRIVVIVTHDAQVKACCDVVVDCGYYPCT